MSAVGQVNNCNWTTSCRTGVDAKKSTSRFTAMIWRGGLCFSARESANAPVEFAASSIDTYTDLTGDCMRIGCAVNPSTRLYVCRYKVLLAMHATTAVRLSVCTLHTRAPFNRGVGCQ